jgi:hypothetical protein
MGRCEIVLDFRPPIDGSSWSVSSEADNLPVSNSQSRRIRYVGPYLHSPTLDTGHDDKQRKFNYRYSDMIHITPPYLLPICSKCTLRLL